MKQLRIKPLILALVAVMMCNAVVFGGEKDTSYNGFPIIRGCTYLNTSEGDKSLPYAYSDGYFTDKTRKDNPHLATASMMIARETVNKNHITKIFADLGYKGLKLYDYKTTPTQNTIGTAIATKKIDDFTLVCIACRGSDYYAEWASNFDLGITGDTTGMCNAAVKAYQRIGKYLKNKDIKGKVKFWITGYSRGGAVSNYIGKKLSDKYGNNKVFCYTFEAPNYIVVRKEQEYPNIKNYVNFNDIVPMLYPESLGFGKYGMVNIYADTRSESFDQEEVRFLNQYQLICKKDFEYTNPKDFKDMTTRTTVDEFLKILAGEGASPRDKNMTAQDFYKKLMVVAQDTLFSSRERYAVEIPNDVIAAANHMGVQPVSFQQALMSLGNTYMGISEIIVGSNFVNIKIDKKYVRPILNGAKYLITGRGESDLFKFCDTLWDLLNTSNGDYVGSTDMFGEELGQDIKAAIPTIICAARELVKGDYYRDTQILSNVIANWNIIYTGHNEILNYLWIRSYDSFLN